MTEINFEASFQRLEEIVDKINQGTTSLEDSLKLYEEADKLIKSCQKKLGQAEEKIEILVKGREQKVALDDERQPITEPLR